MKKSFGFIFAGVFAVASLVACSGLGGVSEGDECGGAQDDCRANLTCQPIAGRGHSYCCPSPASVSGKDNCHASK